MARKTAGTFQKLKDNNEKIAMLTAYDYSTAQVLEEAGIDGILVGDSLAQVVLGYESTHSVTLDEMLIFVKAVSRGAKNSFIVGDMPFMSYNIDIESALTNGKHIPGKCFSLQYGAFPAFSAVKLMKLPYLAKHC